MHGTRNHGGRSATAVPNAKTPQKNTSRQIGTTIFCAALMPTRFAARSNATSNKTLFHCFAMYSPGACPFSINCASQALYTWLARSPASIRRCHQQGIRSSEEMKKTAMIPSREDRQSARSLPPSRVMFSAKPGPHFGTPLPHSDSRGILLFSIGGRRTRGGIEQCVRRRNDSAINEMSGECYFEAWFSPRRFRRSRKRRCSGVGVLGLNATRYQRGWVRSLLNQASVCGSELGCRATFSRIAP